MPYVLCGRPNLPQTTLADLLALKGKGGPPLSAGHIGPGSLIQLLGLSFEKAAGLALNHVPYRGVPPLIQDLIGGQVDLAFLPLAGPIAANIEQAKLRTFGLSTPRPSSLLPQGAAAGGDQGASRASTSTPGAVCWCAARHQPRCSSGCMRCGPRRCAMPASWAGCAAPAVTRCRC